MRVRLVAECVDKGRPRTVAPLEGACLERLALLSGAADATLFASVLELVGLLESYPAEGWTLEPARAAAARDVNEHNQADVLVLLGRRVWQAFGGPPTWPWFRDWPAGWRKADGLTFAAPLPSARNRVRRDDAVLAAELGFWRAIWDASSRANASPVPSAARGAAQSEGQKARSVAPGAVLAPVPGRWAEERPARRAPPPPPRCSDLPGGQGTPGPDTAAATPRRRAAA